MYCLKESRPLHSVSDSSIAILQTLKLFVEMGHDWIYFVKLRWSLVCSYIVIVDKMHKISD
jgi:hypothetical protein